MSAKGTSPTTLAQVKHALKLKDEQGLEWSVISERMGIKAVTLRHAIHRYRKGTFVDVSARTKERTEAIVERLRAGERPIDVAWRVGASERTVRRTQHQARLYERPNRTAFYREQPGEVLLTKELERMPRGPREIAEEQARETARPLELHPRTRGWRPKYFAA